MKVLKKIILALVVLLATFTVIVAFQYLFRGNPKRISSPSNRGTNREIVAHRGVHLNYQKGVYDRRTGCEAKHIFKPTHSYIENTLESIGAAFDFGATIVEIDIRKTSDKNLVVFHDSMLDCRTDGAGYISDHSVGFLKTVDIGYGYTHDNGESFPFRGRGTGKMPTLEEVLTAFPQKKFLIDHKDGDIESTEILIQILGKYPEAQRKNLFYWGPVETLERIQEEFPEIKRFFLLRRQAKKHFIPFLLSFGLAEIPDEYSGLAVGFPTKYLKYLWGWPYRFLEKIHKTGLRFFLIVDSKEEAEKYRDLPVDGYVTDYIEIVGRHLNEKILQLCITRI